MTKDPLTGREQADLRIVSHSISKAMIPQIQGQPQIETDQASLDLGSVVPTTVLLDSSRLPEELRTRFTTAAVDSESPAMTQFGMNRGHR
jgi:hypothetical protein